MEEIPRSVLLDWITAITAGDLKVRLSIVCINLLIIDLIACTQKTRILDVVYNASNNELVRTKTLVKNAIVQIDATPFRHWYEQHYCLPLGRKTTTKKGSNKEVIYDKSSSSNLHLGVVVLI